MNLKPVKPDDRLKRNDILLYTDGKNDLELFAVVCSDPYRLQLVCLSDGIFWMQHRVQELDSIAASDLLGVGFIQNFYYTPEEFRENYETAVGQCAKCFRMGVVPKLFVHSYPAVVEMKNENESKE